MTRSGHDVKVSLPSLLREAIRDQLWKQLRKADGSKYEDAVDWLEDGLPNGCFVGIDRTYFSRDEIAAIIKDLGESETTQVGSESSKVIAPPAEESDKSASRANRMDLPEMVQGPVSTRFFSGNFQIIGRDISTGRIRAFTPQRLPRASRKTDMTPLRE